MIDDNISFNGYIIYALVDPRNDEVRYVGITDNMTNRFMHHLRETGARTVKGQWLEDLSNCGIQPSIKILEKIQIAKAQRSLAEERETHWIRTFEQSGASLTNVRDTVLDTRASSKSHKSDTDNTIYKQKRQKEQSTLDELRKRAGLQVKELADLARISDTSLREMIRGRAVSRTLAFRVLYVLSRYLGYEITPDMIKGLRYL